MNFMEKTTSVGLAFALTGGHCLAQQAQPDMGVSATQTEVKVEKLAETSCSWDGRQLPVYPAATPEITILRYTFPPHQRLAAHRHSVINCGVMLRGELTIVTADGKEKTFKAGESLVEMFGEAHYGENRGDEPTEVIMFYAGAEGLPLKEEPE